MKLQACLYAAVAATKVKEAANKAAKKAARQVAKSLSDEPIDTCIYTEKNGITRVTTEPGLSQMTKCSKRFHCTDGARVQIKVNEMGLGTYYNDDCSKNFVKFHYSVPREDFGDYYHWTDHICDDDLERGYELGKWTTMESGVLFTFEWNDNDEFYAWYYSYSQYIYDYYAGEDPHPYPHYPAEKIAKFDISFKCSNVPDEPDTTTPIPEPTINPNYNKIDQERFCSNDRITGPYRFSTMTHRLSLVS